MVSIPQSSGSGIPVLRITSTARMNMLEDGGNSSSESPGTNTASPNITVTEPDTSSIQQSNPSGTSYEIHNSFCKVVS